MVAYLKPKFSTPRNASEHYFSQPLPASTTLFNDPDQQLCEMSAAFSSLCQIHFGLDFPKDFLILSVKAMNRLHEVKRSNVLYQIAKGCGEMRPDGSDLRFPTTRMPMGLLEYMVGFFTEEEMRRYNRHNHLCYLRLTVNLVSIQMYVCMYT